MSNTLVMLTHVPTDAVRHRHFIQPDLPAYPADIVECDVFNLIAALDALAHMSPLAGVFSNSDHLQTVKALAAANFGLPGKDWRSLST